MLLFITITRLTQLIYNINRIFSTFNTSARGGVVVTLKNRLCMTCGGAAGLLCKYASMVVVAMNNI